MNFINAKMLLVVGFEAVLVLLAMMIDLVSGVRKAKLNGEEIKSDGFKRTVMKFIIYEGGLAIAMFMDAVIHGAGFYQVFGLDNLVGVPFFSTIVTLYLLLVEWVSVREKADVKKRRKEEAVLKAFIDAVGTEKVQKFLQQVRIESEKAEKMDENE